MSNYLELQLFPQEKTNSKIYNLLNTVCFALSDISFALYKSENSIWFSLVLGAYARDGLSWIRRTFLAWSRIRPTR